MEQIQNKKSNHIEWLDVAKGLGIFLICCGHIFYEAPTRMFQHVTYSFLSAFFFVLSGFVFSMRRKTTFFEFAKNKFLRIIVPTILFVAIAMIVAIAFFNVRDPIVLVRYFFYYDGTYEYNMPCWFFVSLFFAYIFCYLLRVPKQKVWVKILMMIGFYVLGFLAYSQMNYIDFEYNPFVRFGFDRTFIVTGFFIYGNLLRDLYNKIDIKRHFKYIMLSFLPLIALWLLFGIALNDTTSIYRRELGNYWSFIASSTFGCPAFFIVSILLSYVKCLVPVFKGWGKNTILIASTHYICRWCRLLLAVFNNAVGIAGTHWVSLVIPFYAIILCLLYIPLGYLLDKYVPYLTGVEPTFYRELREKRKQKKLLKEENELNS